MDALKLYKLLDEGKEVCVYDDYDEVAVRVVPPRAKRVAYIKHKTGGREAKVDRIDNRAVMKTVMEGEQITREEYDKIGDYPDLPLPYEEVYTPAPKKKRIVHKPELGRLVERIFDYIPVNGTFYILNPSYQLAYRTVMVDGDCREVYVKCKGGKEKLIDMHEDGYCKAFFFNLMLTKREYESY